MSAEYFVYTFLPGFFGFLFGSCIGSGYLCYIMRRKIGESWMRGRSHCDSCGHTLHLLDLIPVISYLASGGRCRYCRAKIPPICCITELTFGACMAVYISELTKLALKLPHSNLSLWAAFLILIAFAVVLVIRVGPPEHDIDDD